MDWRRGGNIRFKVENGETSTEWYMMKTNSGDDMRGMESMETKTSETGVGRGAQDGNVSMIRGMIDEAKEVTGDEIGVVEDTMTEIEIEEEMIITDGGEHTCKACSRIRCKLAWDSGIGLMFFINLSIHGLLCQQQAVINASFPLMCNADCSLSPTSNQANVQRAEQLQESTTSYAKANIHHITSGHNGHTIHKIHQT